MVSLLSEFNCSLNSKVVVVTDRGSNMIAAFKEDNNIHCISHLIHNTVEKCIKKTTQIDELISLCSKLVKFFKKSGLNAELETSLKSFCTTRWNSVYYTICSIVKNFAAIQDKLLEKNLVQKYSIIKLYNLENLMKILKLFKDASDDLEGSLYPTIHLVYANIEHLKSSVSIEDDDPSLIKEFKINLQETITSLIDPNITMYHKLGLFLFPPANKLTQFSLDESEEIINYCKSLLTPYADNITLPVNSTATNSSRMFSLFGKHISPSETTANSSVSAIDSEILKYKNTNVTLYDDFNILQWWNENKNEFPLLFKLSCRILAIPASSAPSERVFSIARTILTDKRSQMTANSKSFNEIMFVNINSKD